MDIAEIFYLVATIVLILVGLVAIYIFYMVYKLSFLIKQLIGTTKRATTLVSTVKYSAQAAIFKTILNILGGKGGDKDDKK